MLDLKKVTIILFVFIIVLLIYNLIFYSNKKMIMDELKYLELENNINFENYVVTDPYFYCKYDMPRCKNKYNSYRYDENNIPIVKINDVKTYNPTTITQNGLFAYSIYKSNNDSKMLDNAVNILNYLISKIDEQTGILYYNFDFKVGGTNETLIAPWGSAMAQGQFLSLLSRIYLETKNETYLEFGDKVIKPLTISVEKGGLLANFDKYKFFEEYPTKNSNYTLNGFMFTLMGLYDFCEATNNTTSCLLYDDGIKTLEYILPFFDYGNISLYHLAYKYDTNLMPHYSEKYHNVHIRQLTLLDEIENNKIFRKYIKKWKEYLNNE